MSTDNTTDAWPLTCPVCQEDLSHSGNALTCAAGHSFDVAREGYVNLLPSQHRVSGVDGDTPDMLRARRRFLEAGHYEPLLARLSVHAGDVLATRTSKSSAGADRTSIVEIGCGEGYYVGGLAHRLGDDPAAKVEFIGADLSKAAVLLAAKRYREVTFMVADVNRRIHVRDGSASVLLDVFAPRNPTEFARILEPGGTALVAIPGPDHLASLRDELGLLGIQEGKEALVIERFAERFRLAEKEALEYPLELTPDAARDLVGMGPNRWHRDGESPAADGARETTASFVVLRFERLDVQASA